MNGSISKHRQKKLQLAHGRTPTRLSSTFLPMYTAKEEGKGTQPRSQDFSSPGPPGAREERWEGGNKIDLWTMGEGPGEVVRWSAFTHLLRHGVFNGERHSPIRAEDWQPASNDGSIKLLLFLFLLFLLRHFFLSHLLAFLFFLYSGHFVDFSA